MTIDNWYTSVPQGTVGTTLFGFQKDKMVVSYVTTPKWITKKLNVILDYNENKGGVDTVGEMCAAHSISRLTKRWSCVVFYTLMKIGGIIVQILYSQRSQV